MTTLVDFIENQIKFSRSAFGPDTRTKGIIDHIKKELIEVEESGGSINEWVDVALLAIDGMQRAATKFNEEGGIEASPALVAMDVADCLAGKLEANKRRSWPDWRKVDPEKAIEHVRS